MAACDPVFNYIRPVVTKYLTNQQDQITGLEWCQRQLSYVDAQVAPLPYGPKTYFYGETDEGFTRITLDYHSFQSAALPGLIKEAVFEHNYFGETGLGRTKYYIGEDNNFWIQSGFLPPQKSNRSLINIKVGIKNLTAFDTDVIPVGTGAPDASLALIMGSGFGQLHRFKKLGGIVYHDLNTLYSRGSGGFILGALSVASGILVSGAGTQYVNRKYIPIGFYNKKLFYSGLSLSDQKENGEVYNDAALPGKVLNIIFWEPSIGWVIGNAPDDYYYSNQDTATPNSVTGLWSIPGPNGPQSPAPKVIGIASNFEKPYFLIDSSPSEEIRKIYEVYWQGNPLESTGKSYTAENSVYVNSLNKKLFNFINDNSYETSTPKALADTFSPNLETKYSAIRSYGGGGTAYYWTISAEILRPSQGGNPNSISVYRGYGGTNSDFRSLDEVTSWDYVFGPGPVSDPNFKMTKNSTYSGILNFASNFIKYNADNICPPNGGGGGGGGGVTTRACDSLQDALDRISGDGGIIVTGQFNPPGFMNEGWTGVEWVEEPEQLCCPPGTMQTDIPVPPDPNDDNPEQRFIRACISCRRAVDRSSINRATANTLSINENGEFIINQ